MCVCKQKTHQADQKQNPGQFSHIMTGPCHLWHPLQNSLLFFFFLSVHHPTSYPTVLIPQHKLEGRLEGGGLSTTTILIMEGKSSQVVDNTTTPPHLNPDYGRQVFPSGGQHPPPHLSPGYGRQVFPEFTV